MSALPWYAAELIPPRRFKVVKGGRGSAKSFSTAKLLLWKGMEQRCFVLCAREFQNSIADSVHKLLSEQVEELGMLDFYKITKDSIIGKNGTRFMFRGVHGNINSIKSIPGITDVWLEEAHTMSAYSWEVLEPTIREPGSEFWVTYNPEGEDDPTHVKFCGPEGPPPDSIVIEANWRDNPWFPDILKVQKEHMEKTNPDLAMHIWEGQVRSNSDAQVFKGKWSVENFEINPKWEGPYFGADWGFSVDPTALTKTYIDTENQTIYIAEEAGGVGIELDHIEKLFDTVKETRTRRIRADNARPETISYLKRKGFDIIAADKWKGSVEDGIEFLKNYKIVIHGSCPETRKEFRLYSYKVDKLTNDVTVKIVDAYNHYIDSLRYGLDPMIAANGKGILGVL